jgi:hypothetical protein
MEKETQKATKYRVRDMMTGLYLDGGYNNYFSEPLWSKKGKTWKKLEDLKSHFNLLEEQRISLSPFWEIIEVITTSKEVKEERYPATVFVPNKRNKT